MPERLFPPPWKAEEYRGISYIVRDANNFPVALEYCETSSRKKLTNGKARCAHLSPRSAQHAKRASTALLEQLNSSA
jgi:hypothetical protein